jgi:hypothetical protein
MACAQLVSVLPIQHDHNQLVAQLASPDSAQIQTDLPSHHHVQPDLVSIGLLFLSLAASVTGLLTLRDNRPATDKLRHAMSCYSLTRIEDRPRNFLKPSFSESHDLYLGAYSVVRTENAAWHETHTPPRSCTDWLLTKEILHAVDPHHNLPSEICLFRSKPRYEMSS